MDVIESTFDFSTGFIGRKIWEHVRKLKAMKHLALTTIIEGTIPCLFLLNLGESLCTSYKKYAICLFTPELFVG